jgi:tetratricopeptide (TPR) repeat protein
MEITNTVNPDSLFISVAQQQSQLENLSNSALTNGIDLYVQGKYEAATKAFQRSISLAPNSPNSIKASNYMAEAYLQLNETEKAIKTYKRSASLNPNLDEPHIQLGNLYFFEERYAEAEIEYEKAVDLNPTANNRYTLGQAYIETGRFSDAEVQFNQVQRLEPDKPKGSYGLGLTYSKQGRYEDAIRQFEAAISLDNDLYAAYAEIGYAYADLGQMDAAQEQLDFLDQNDPDLADVLSRYMYKVDRPKFIFAHATSTFQYSMPESTPLSVLDAYLENANASKTFTMKFQFDKDMERESVENRYNWTINRSAGSGPGQAYNFGRSIPESEIRIAPFPDDVIYDAKTLTATLTFSIHQNADANGTLDPAHIEFKFRGEDQFGLKMDPDHDQFSGFSGIT